MLRRLTQDVGRYKKGSFHDWPQATWCKVAEEAKKTVDAISKAEELDQVFARRPLIGGTKKGAGRTAAAH